LRSRAEAVYIQQHFLDEGIFLMRIQLPKSLNYGGAGQGAWRRERVRNRV